LGEEKHAVDQRIPKTSGVAPPVRAVEVVNELFLKKFYEIMERSMETNLLTFLCHRIITKANNLHRIKEKSYEGRIRSSGKCGYGEQGL
jgi:hypothetical protein